MAITRRQKIMVSAAFSQAQIEALESIAYQTKVSRNEVIRIATDYYLERKGKDYGLTYKPGKE